MEAVRKWYEEFKQLCQYYFEHDSYIYLGLVQKFGELEGILQDSEFEVKDEET